VNCRILRDYSISGQAAQTRTKQETAVVHGEASQDSRGKTCDLEKAPESKNLFRMKKPKRRQEEPMPQLLYTRRQTAEILACHPNTVSNYAEAGVLDAVEIGGRLMVRRTSLERLIREGHPRRPRRKGRQKQPKTEG
jgi:hypothetical protein